MSDTFYKFSPFIRDFIYKNGWETLRPVQVDAAKVIFETDRNLLLASSTASGKTEAAFFPVLSMLCDDPPQSFGVLYIAPLKSLINDQFERIEALLDLTGIPVFRWHGDVSASQKAKALKNPCGILQITPESLESMLMNRPNDIVRLFCDLRFVIIDEVHVLSGSDRGNQIMCQLSRISKAVGISPRRIGLSATTGDPAEAGKWLGEGSGRETAIVGGADGKTSWRLALEHFYIANPNEDQTSPAPSGKRAVLDPGFEFVYDCTNKKKCLLFSNSREETEYATATLRKIAEVRGEEDRFLIHHGNLSAALREEAEAKLRDDDIKCTACATVTLELGIDIGKLERVIQLEAPTSVSSLLQRLGRSGRRGEPSEMIMVFREEDPLPNTPLPELIPWELLRAIAIIQLYIEERFIEPPKEKKYPFSLLFQQTLSILSVSGESKPKDLAAKVLSLPPFGHIDREEYKTLLLSMIKNGFVEMTEDKGLIVGLAGERLISSFKFYAVFNDSEDFTVRCKSDEIGTITSAPPVGDRFALAGRVWEVEELDIARKLIYVKQVKGKMEIAWPGDSGEIHTRILERMKRVLEEDTIYPYLRPNAIKRLTDARTVARNTGMLTHSVVSLGGYTMCMFPWLGTRSFRTMRKFIKKNGAALKISNIEFSGCCYITFRQEIGDAATLVSHLKNRMSDGGINTLSLVGDGETAAFDKYDRFIPAELLHLAYAEDRLRPDEAETRINEMYEEFFGDQTNTAR